MPYALCYFLTISDNGGCKLQKRKKRSLKIARRKETGKISDESPSKVGFLGSTNVSISSCNGDFTLLSHNASFQMEIDKLIVSI
jgi:hypothetical protein